MVLLIDNYDSFTYNVAQYFKELGADILVRKNDEINLHEIDTLAPEHIVISPGPGKPRDSGISIPAIQRFAGRIPILGVCLGHQCIGEVFGAKVVKAKTIMHGKTSSIAHSASGVFAGLAQGFAATRYHSLVLAQDSLPQEIMLSAWTENAAGEFDEVMAIKHRQMRLEGVQFHPESILSQSGHRLFENFLRGE